MAMAGWDTGRYSPGVVPALCAIAHWRGDPYRVIYQ